jgi:uroporphyrinogen decarboxylase
MSHRQRMEACLAGVEPDRPPVSMWRHFPVDDQSPESLASAVVEFQNAYDFDFVKVTPSSSFSIYDWGSRDVWRGSSEGTREYIGSVIKRPEDWESLGILDSHSGHLGSQLDCLRLITKELGPEVPVIQTIFSPLSQAKNLAGRSNLLVHIRRYPEALQAGLKTIAETTQQFIEAAKQTGIAGIFFAVQHAQYGLLSADEYSAFGRRFDLPLLRSAEGMWLNILHLHGDEVMFDQVADYSVEVINWHDRNTPPSLSVAKESFPGVVCGGLKQWETMVLGTPVDVAEEARDAIQSTRGQRFILGTGCVLPIITPRGNILAARRSVEIGG